MPHSSRSLVLKAPILLIYEFIEKKSENILENFIIDITGKSPSPPRKEVVSKDPPTKLESFVDFGWGRTMHISFNLRSLSESLTEVHYIIDIGGMYEFLYGIRIEVLMDLVFYSMLKSFEAGYIASSDKNK